MPSSVSIILILTPLISVFTLSNVLVEILRLILKFGWYLTKMKQICDAKFHIDVGAL